MDYREIYRGLIEKAKSEKREYRKGTYYERHHIKPRCLGGEGKSWDWKTHPNLVLLTAKEHYLAHRLLSEVYPNNKMIQKAFCRMCFIGKDTRKNYRISSGTYERAKLLSSELRQGVPKTKESIEKRTATRRLRGNYVRPREAVEKMLETKRRNNSFSRGPLSEEHKQKLSEKKIGNSNSRVPVLHVESGKIYDSRKKLLEELGISCWELTKGLRSKQYELLKPRRKR